MHRAALSIIVAVGLGAGAYAAPLFQPKTLDAALAAAREADQPVLALFSARWSLAGARVEQAIWGDAALRTLIEKRVVSVRLEVSADDDLARRLRIETVPTLLLLGADGAERDILMPTADPAQFRADLEAALAGTDAVARAQALIDRLGPGNPLGHEHLAIALDRRGRHADALAAYLQCMDVGLRNVPYAAARRDSLAAALAQLAKAYPPARAAADERRTAWREKLRSGRDDVDLARNLAAFNLAFDDEADTLAVYDALPPTAKARRVLHDRVLNQLIDAKRYQDAAADGELLHALRNTIFQATRGDGGACCSLHAPRGPGSGLAVVERGARLVEAAVALGQEDQARKIMIETLKFEDTPENRATLRERLKRAGGENRTLIELLDK